MLTDRLLERIGSVDDFGESLVMPHGSEWRWEYHGEDPLAEGQREALCTLGNGYFATRGAAPEAVADEIHYPATYVAGVYNRLRAEVAGHTVENESLVNAPNWLCFSVRPEAGQWLGDDGNEILSHHQQLDMYQGLLVRRTRWRDRDGSCVPSHPAPFRQHARPPPGRPGDHGGAGELDGSPRSQERPGRDRKQQRCGSLPCPGFGTSVTA